MNQLPVVYKTRRARITAGLIASAFAFLSMALPAAVLALDVGDCWDLGQPVEFENVLEHICDEAAMGCPQPYIKCYMVGPTGPGCPDECKYRRTLQYAAGFYCFFTDDPNDSCRWCPKDYVCEKYGSYTDSACRNRCPVIGCKSGYRTEQGLCSP